MVAVANGIRFCITLFAGAALCGEVAKEASWKLEAMANASPQTPANPRPIPTAGPLADPKTLIQVGVPIEAHSGGGSGGQPADI